MTDSTCKRTDSIMISKVILVVLGLAALVAADSFESYEYARPRYSSEESYESSEGIYDFNWNVNHNPSRNAFGHQAAGNGDNAQGTYFVNLPDGRRQTVNFVVDGDSGYIADVTYSGEAQFPDSPESYESRVAPGYYYDSNESK